ARVSQDSCDLRQCEVPRLQGGARIPREVVGADRAPLSAEVRSGDEPHRTGVVAPARDDHPESPLPHSGRAPAGSLCLGGDPPYVLFADTHVPKALSTRFLALRLAGGAI